jgi:DNA-binding transcriptional MerR regulator
LDHKAPDAFRTISEVADELDLPQHVLRFWESRFRDIKPMKRGGGRRYYRPDDVDLLRGIRHLLYGEGYTIRGVQRILRGQGARFVQVVWQEGAPQPPHGASEDEEFSTEAPAEVEVLDDERGLRGRLSSLLGRDLGDRRDDVEARREPPLQSAPVPRVDPGDRATHGMDAPEPKPVASAAELRPGVATNAANAESVTPESREILPRENLRKLHAALHELAECRKLIDAAVTRAE